MKIIKIWTMFFVFFVLALLMGAITIIPIEGNNDTTSYSIEIGLNEITRDVGAITGFVISIVFLVRAIYLTIKLYKNK